MAVPHQTHCPLQIEQPALSSKSLAFPLLEIFGNTCSLKEIDKFDFDYFN